MMEMADNGDLLDYIRVNGARPDAEARVSSTIRGTINR
jgi:hypothetical protein